MNGEAIIDAVLLLLIANGAPILARNALGQCCAGSIDGGIRAFDGRRLLGPNKTWRGLLVASLGCLLAAPLLGIAPLVAAGFGLAAMLADLAGSFLKRRLGVAPSDSVLILDQVPEALLPLLVFGPGWAMGAVDITLATGLFVALDLLLSRLLYALHIRVRPR